MLSELSIRNFTVIDDLSIEFLGGLTVLSGETGAGKSVIINAVNLVLGNRASSDLIRTGCETAEIEARFDISPESKTWTRMLENDLDPEDGLFIRRVISRNNRHRVYVNGRGTTMARLMHFTENLAGISGQHAHQKLLQEDVQLLLLDQFGELMPLRDRVSKIYQQIVPLVRKKKELAELKMRRDEKRELLDFQYNEITMAGVRPGEDEALAQERRLLKNGTFLYETINDCINAFYDSHGSVTELVSQASVNMEKAAAIDPNLSGIDSGIKETAYQIEDLTASLRSYLNTIQIDPNRLEAVEARIDALTRLKRKYGGSLDTVIGRLADIEAELAFLENINRDVDSVTTALADFKGDLCHAATDLSANRKRSARCMSDSIEAELEDLRMADTRFSVSFSTRPADESVDPYLVCDGKAIFDTGFDRVTFMISPNVGEDVKPLAGIASGGELSRVVLAIKGILAKSDALETIIFDEVDAGIGGGAADVVGRKLLAISGHHQVICITHLPQIARFADHHYKITKQVENGRTTTTISRIEKEDRAGEIARMLGGEKITAKTLEHAAELLEKKK